MREKWWIFPLYGLLAALPLGAAFRVYLHLSPWIAITPGIYVPSGRNGIWVLPIVNLLFAIALYHLTAKLGKVRADRAKAAGRETDILQVLPGTRVCLLAFLSGICLAVVYGYHILDTGQMTMALIGRIVAFVSGAYTALFALRLPRATRKNMLALRFRFTEKSDQVWLRVHKLGARLLYVTGAVMMGTAFLLSGLQAAFSAIVALCSALLTLCLYARKLYEDEFRP